MRLQSNHALFGFIVGVAVLIYALGIAALAVLDWPPLYMVADRGD